jgi:hypothetical protein
MYSNGWQTSSAKNYSIPKNGVFFNGFAMKIQLGPV